MFISIVELRFEQSRGVILELRDDDFLYLVGEALVGEGDEVAHIDLIIGDKRGLWEMRLLTD